MLDMFIVSQWGPRGKFATLIETKRFRDMVYIFVKFTYRLADGILRTKKGGSQIAHREDLNQWEAFVDRYIRMHDLIIM
jgi:hypothetical protein